jgi:NADH-quinone oxidoreductase subunit J
MSFEQLIFYALSLVLIFAAGMVVTVRNPVHAAMFLVVAFFTSAGLWLLLEAEFLAITLVLVYVGAVMVLFLFVVMMLDIDVARLREGFARYAPIGAVVALAIVAVMVTVLAGDYFSADQMPAPAHHAADYSNTRALGSVLYTDYVYPFEIASVVLLVAIIAAITLTLRRRPDTKYQRPEEQVTAKRSDRVRMVEMKPEERR